MHPTVLLLAAALVASLATGADLPLIAHYPMDGGEPFRDQGGLGIQAKPGKSVSADPDGKTGGCWRFTGKHWLDLAHEGNEVIYDFIGSPLTLGMWVNPDALPPDKGHAILLSKRISGWQGYSFTVAYEADGAVTLSTQNGRDTVNVPFGRLSKGVWTHLAFTHAPDGDVITYRDGKESGRARLEGSISSNDLPLLVGGSEDNGGKSKYTGRIDDLRMYAAALDAATVAAIVEGKHLPTRQAKREDIAPDRMPVALRLVRFDMALGFRNRDGGYPEMTRMTCRRIDGADVVDWPRMWVGDRELFAKEAEERVLSFRRLHQNAGPVFQQAEDPIIHPGNHWYRPLCWLWGQTYTYTTDCSMRGGGSELEIWTFPLLIKAAQPGGIKTAKLTCDGRVLYERTWEKPLDSLTLCLPQNRPGPAYELSVNGSKSTAFDAGLKPVTLGDPREEVLPVTLILSGSPAVTVQNLEVPEIFPFNHELKKQITHRYGSGAADRPQPL